MGKEWRTRRGVRHSFYINWQVKHCAYYIV
nr:MAG TPA: hypothetical protein [Caudoviricetes sp.]